MKFTDNELIDALEKSGGFRTETARLLGVTRSAITNRLNSNDELKEIVTDIEERRLDIAETSLIRAVECGEPWAVQFYLKRKGKRRGYGDKEENEEKRSKFQVKRSKYQVSIV